MGPTQIYTQAQIWVKKKKTPQNSHYPLTKT